ncbi:MAG TPA: phage tail sheath C-terminal domain-containing protein [Methanoregulaceae archaeon]|nr:phage tail sheath C-terminal domain-containing protein [Methanoregulaceae archaeon]
MVEVSYPGVYIEEVSSGVHTITGVSTSIGAFIGRTMSGPTDTAVRCLGWGDFSRAFGDAHPKNRLAQSVQQFFKNGGTDCYVVRLAPGAKKAGVTLKNISKEEVLAIKAKSKGAWGNNLRLMVDYNTTNPDETFNLHVLLEKDGTVVSKESFTALSMDEKSPRFAPDFVTQSSSLITVEKGQGFNASNFPGYSESRRPFKTTPATIDDLIQDGLKAKLEELIQGTATTKPRNSFSISVNDREFRTVELTDAVWNQADKAAIIQELEIQINAQLGGSTTVKCDFKDLTGDYQVITIESATDPYTSVRIQRAPANDIAGPLMLGVEQGGVEYVAGYENRPVPTALYYKGEANDLAASALTTPFDLVITSPAGTSTTTVTLAGDPWFKEESDSSISEGNDGVRQKLDIITNAVNNDANLPFRAEVWGYHIAFIPKKGTISSTLTLDGSTSWDSGIKDEFIGGIGQYPLGITPLTDYAVYFGTGLDESIQLKPDDYFGSVNDQTGIHALDSVDIFNLMVIPDDEEIDEKDRLSIYAECSTYCKEKRGFLLMDAPSSWTDTNTGRPKATQNDINAFRAQVVKDYSAVFYPNIRYMDSRLKKTMGPSGVVAGLFARTDATRGVWKAPAGIDTAMIGVVDLHVNLTDRENGVYNKLGANCLRVFPNGFVNWGARTMAGFDDNTDTDWKYIPIRRLALFIEESLFRGTKWVVFEPNDEPLWAAIRLNIGAFMMSLFRRGAFQGSSPKEAFYVKCDKETTTQDDRNKGIVNIEVGFAPLKPAEFVVIKIQQIAGEL